MACVAAPIAAAVQGPVSARVLVGAIPDWVLPADVDLGARHPAGQTSDGVHFLLSDEQTQLGRRGRVFFRHVASRAIDQRGVESVAHISLDFDPTYESPKLNLLRVHRGGTTQDRLPAATIKVLQRERDLEARIYDGSQTIDISLDDVRPGDVVEYAYTVQGSNPVFAGHESGAFNLQWSVPLAAMYRRIVAPKETKLRWQGQGGAKPPEVSAKGEWLEYVWRASNVRPVIRPGKTPSWWVSYANIEWTTYADWSEVARWAEGLYSSKPVKDVALANEVARIAASTHSPEEKVSAVLDFVQSNIRYLGIEIGSGSHAPRPPEVVLERRFGDCKDKVILAVTMLRELGVEAYPALVSTILRSTSDKHLSMPTLFNHVVLMARADGREWWLDPTRSPQHGKLDRISQANFGQALVLDGKSTKLSVIPVADPSIYRKQIELRLDASKGFDLPVGLKVITHYEGVSAEEMREVLRSRNLDELQLEYQNWYGRDYPGLKRVEEITVGENTALNGLTTQEHYEIQSLVRRDNKDTDVIWLYARDMTSLLDRPKDTVRLAPLSIAHPEETSVAVTLLLPDDRVLKPYSGTVRDKAFEFTEEETQRNRELALRYTYRTLADRVAPADLEGHIAKLESARKRVGYTLRPAMSAKQDPVRLKLVSITKVLVALGLLAVLATTVGFWATRDVEPPEPLRTRSVLLTGLVLHWGLLVVFVLYAIMEFGFAGGSANWWVIAATLVLLPVLSAVVWTDRWLAWVSTHAADSPKVLHFARRLVLPTRKLQLGKRLRAVTLPA